MTRAPRRYWIMCMLCLSMLTACEADKPIPHDKMVLLMADYSIAAHDGQLAVQSMNKLSPEQLQGKYAHVAAVFAHHDITAEAFYEAWEAYLDDLPAMEKLIDGMIAELNQRTALQKGQWQPLQPGSIDFLHLKTPRKP
jgi:hypothetical protein